MKHISLNIVGESELADFYFDDKNTMHIHHLLHYHKETKYMQLRQFYNYPNKSI
jgi:hypothetical protein